MRHLLSFLALLLVAVPSFAADAKPVPLFDGKTLTGWEGDEKTWKVEDGAIVAGSLDTVMPRNEYLCTKTSYENFELKVTLKRAGERKKANGGIQFRTKRIPNDHEVIGYQADGGPEYWGALTDLYRHRGLLACPKKETVEKIAKYDDWNDYVIRCEGPRIRLWLNGTLTVDYTETDEKVEKSGVVGLVIHGGAKAKAYYKNITIEELPAKK
jgi:hypothetical protein